MNDPAGILWSEPLDAHATIPPFEQLKRRITEGASGGALVAGTRLPPVRTLAERVGLSPNTVARTYRELEQAGVLETRGRAGTFVAAPDAAEREAAAAAAVFAQHANALGVGRERALALVAAALDARAID